jgi:MoaA/NifB/PqqE/SkfB family radical SAM enzyme
VIDEIKKALAVRKNPGMSDRLTLPMLMRQAVPFALSPTGRARPPLTVYWSVNSVCNLHCKMCDVGTSNSESNFFANLRIDGKLHEIKIERFKSVIDEVARYRPAISITSTEPLMYKPLGEAVAYARSCDLDVVVTTGGYLLPQRAQELAEAGLSRLVVSIDGPAALHNEIRGRKDSFERSADGIIRFRAACERRGHRAQVLVNHTISNLNYGELESFYDAVDALPIDRINFNYMNYVTRDLADRHNAIWGEKYRATVNCLSDETQPDRVDVNALHQQIAVVKRRDATRGRVAFLPEVTLEELGRYFFEPDKFMGNSRCMVNWFIAEIIASGEVIPYTRCYHVPLGNINEEPFLDIWNGSRARAWRRDLRAQRRFPACTRCDQVY